MNDILFKTAIVLTAVLAAAACRNREETLHEPTAAEIILADGVTPVLGAGEDSVDIAFTSTADWTAEVDQDWCTVSPAEGSSGNQTIALTVAENTSADERNATLIITSGASQTRVMVVQKQKDALTLSSARYEVEAKGGDIVVEVQHNIPFGYVIDTEAAGWIKPIENTKAMSTSTLGFTVLENEGVNKREGTVRIVSGDISEIVTVYQDGSEPSLVLTQTEYAVGSDGGVVVIEVRSNTEYSMTMPAGEDWLSESTAAGASTYTRYVIVTPNNTYESRSAKIVFEDKASGNSETVTITQVQNNAIVVAQRQYIIDAEGGIKRFAINANVDFEVKVSADWIVYQPATKALPQEKEVVFHIAPNETIESRNAVITFTAEGVEQSVEVIQSAATVKSVFGIIYTGTSFMAPTIAGRNLSHATVDWGDNSEEEYLVGKSHTYDGTGPHTVSIECWGAESVTVDNFVGISQVDLSKF